MRTERIVPSRWLLAVLALLGCGDSGESTGGDGGGGRSVSGPGPGSGTSAGGGGAGSPTMSSGSAGGGTKTWRPFSSDSPWNTRIEDAPELDPDSTALIEDLATSTATWNYLDVNMPGFSIPVYYVDGATPERTVAIELSAEGFNPVPIPDGADPDPESDHHIALVDKQQGIEWGMWNAARTGEAWTASVGNRADLQGTGVRPPITSADPWQSAMGARASGFALIAGLIRVDEVEAGKIEHALVIAYPHCRSRYFVPPASTAQGTTSEALPDRGIPMGGRIQLDPSVDVEALGLDDTNKMIARALQEYGAFVGDFSGAISLYAENAPEAQAAWEGVLDADNMRQTFDQDLLRQLRVLKLPEFLDNDN